MKLGLVSDDQFAKELEDVGRPASNQGFIHPAVIVEQDRGRGKGNIEVPDGIRKIIADEALTKGREAALELGKELGVSASSVSAYSNGNTSTASYNQPDQGLTNYLKLRKERITKKALRVLTSSLDSITPEKLQHVKTRDASAIAKDMSVIVKNMNPDENKDGTDNKQPFVIYAPTFRDERSYDSIVVQDNY